MPTKEETKTAEMNFQYDGFLEPDRLLDVLGFAPKGQVSAKPAKKRKAAA
ncbi:MAG: hypothetical protein ABJM02_11865 [Paracoccaceae bacterium]